MKKRRKTRLRAISAARADQRRGHDHAGLAAALGLGAGRVEDQPLGRLVPFGDLRGASEQHPYRTHPDGHLALVLLAAQVLGQFGTGQAGGHLRDVLEELPYLLDRLGDLELVLDQHRVSFLM